MTKRSAAFLILAVVGCSSSGSNTNAGAGTPPPPTTSDGQQLLPDLKPAPAPTNGFQIVTPVVHDLEAGSSHEICTWTDKILDQDIDIKSATGFQTKGGHHIVVYYTDKPQPAGTTRECQDIDMATFRLAIGTGGEGIAAALPGDLAMHVPKGSQIVINHHYLNAGVTTISDAQSAVNINFVDPGAKTTRSGNFAELDTSIHLKPGNSTVKVQCTLQNDIKLWQLTPHMHQWGAHFALDHVKAADKSSSRLIDVQWDPDYAFHPPITSHDPTSPYLLQKGDQLNLQCDFNNTSGGDLTFGMEMCVFFGQTVDTELLGNLACDAGQWGDF